MKNILMFLVAVLMSCHIIAQNTVTGTVIDGSDNTPVIGASVLVKGTTNNGAMTDINGQFTLKVPAGSNTLVISSVGYKTQEVNIAGKKVIKVTLLTDTKQLEEVVVVGYGVQKKKLVTGATLQIKGDNVEKLNTTSALTALQSQSPGVNIIQSSGQPGEGFKVNIRGMGTIGDSQPLYVIDGVAGVDINTLNPADIESIDVLKDAASCAIYGARAANGVILVTTKSGKSGKINVSYDGYYGWQNVYKMPELLNAKQYMQVMDELQFNQGKSGYKWSSLMPQDLYNAYMNGTNSGTNWLEAIRNSNAPIQNHALNITGGTDVSKFSLGVSYTNQDGILGKPVESKFERTTVRLNSDHVIYKADNRNIVTFGETMLYTYKTKNGIGIGNQYSNDISSCLRAWPIVPEYNDKGGYYEYDDLNSGGFFGYDPGASNPVAMMIYTRGQNISKSHNLNMSAYLKIEPIKNLIFKSQFGYKMSSSSYRSYVPQYNINTSSDGHRDAAQVYQSAGQGWGYTVDNTLNYIFNVGEHNFDFMVGQGFEKWGMGEDLSGKNSDLLFNGFDYAWLTNSKSTSATVTGAPWGQGAIASFFGRVNWNYKETYMATAILRADGSSNFARGHRWGYFPSFSAGWVVSNENFMNATKNWMDFLKLRGSWGQNGNCNISNFQYLSTIAFDTSAHYTFGSDKTSYQTGAYPDIISNPNVTWEKSEQLDLGFDARFLNSRLGVNFDWYNKKTKGWLIAAPILATAGTGAPYINGGDVKNTGFELGLSWNDKIGKEFTYGANVNLSYNKNKVTRIANAQGVIYGPEKVLAENTPSVFRAEVGRPLGYFWGYKTAGVFQNQADIDAWKAAGNGILQTDVQPGDLKFVDLDHNGKIETADKTQIGNPNPKYILGLGFNCAYKGFDLSVTAYGNFGQQIARSYRKFTDGEKENYTTEVFDYWHGEGTSNKYPRLTPGNTGVNWQQISDIYIEDADFLKISNITFGYDFKKLWKTSPLAQMRLYVQAQNLLTITGYKGMDPEIGTSSDDSNYSWGRGIDLGYYPQPRTILIGVNLKF
jgi:TonB-linked SusC/RagA family outer membrane protein